jgi:hypothetical protein
MITSCGLLPIFLGASSSERGPAVFFCDLLREVCFWILVARASLPLLAERWVFLTLDGFVILVPYPLTLPSEEDLLGIPVPLEESRVAAGVESLDSELSVARTSCPCLLSLQLLTRWVRRSCPLSRLEILSGTLVSRCFCLMSRLAPRFLVLRDRVLVLLVPRRSRDNDLPRPSRRSLVSDCRPRLDLRGAAKPVGNEPTPFPTKIPSSPVVPRFESVTESSKRTTTLLFCQPFTEKSTVFHVESSNEVPLMGARS